VPQVLDLQAVIYDKLGEMQARDAASLAYLDLKRRLDDSSQRPFVPPETEPSSFVLHLSYFL
jgi:hypothetical protein